MQRGKTFEEKARAFLVRKGYTILETNFRSPFGEIDIIARNKGYIVFVEVKARRKGSMVPAPEALTRRKRRKIERTALFYIQKHAVKECRFDVVCIEAGDDYTRFELFENAFSLNETR